LSTDAIIIVNYLGVTSKWWTGWLNTNRDNCYNTLVFITSLACTDWVSNPDSLDGNGYETQLKSLPETDFCDETRNAERAVWKECTRSVLCECCP